MNVGIVVATFLGSFLGGLLARLLDRKDRDSYEVEFIRKVEEQEGNSDG